MFVDVLPALTNGLAVIAAAASAVLVKLAPIQLGEQGVDQLQLGLAQLVGPANQKRDDRNYNQSEER